MNAIRSSEETRAVVVVVLYQCAPELSGTVQGLEANLRRFPELRDNVKIIVYDNSPESALLTSSDFIYVHAPKNEGLYGAYSFALRVAQQEGFSWLLTLDQDTKLPVDFLSRLLVRAEQIWSHTGIAAIVPQLTERNKALSPSKIRFARMRPLPLGFVGVPRTEVTAFNSGCLWRVTALDHIGGFNSLFWLDYLDHWLQRTIYKSGMRIFVAGDIRVEHELSVLDYKRRLSLVRFRNVLKAESAFVDLYKGFFERLALSARLACRLCKLLVNKQHKTFVVATYEMLRQRLFHRRKHRIAALGQTAARGSSNPIRPKVSICMAAYNGERYIKDQLRSILEQLAKYDEVIIVDDCSMDQTRSIIRSFEDHRIHVIENHINQGVLRSFELAIQSASGEIIFLSDQDDLWASTKVHDVLTAFSLHTDAMVVVSDASLIDENNNVIAFSNFARRAFAPGLFPNLIHSRFVGCTMAFRSCLRPKVLPFPKGLDILHDIWIGTRNSITGGKTVFLKKPLTLYRRHAANVTGNARLSRTRQIRLRLHLLLALAQFSLRRRACAEL